MDYIINPAWFYWIEVADTAKAAAAITMIVLIIACIVLACMMGISHGFEDTEYNNYKKNFVRCFVFAVISAFVFIIVPSKRTLMEMQIAKLATKSNVDLTIEKTKEIVDYIINAMKELK